MKRILITGATSGIGYQAAVKLLKGGHKLIIPARSNERANEIMQKIRKDTSDFEVDNINPTFPIVDLSDLGSIQSFTSRLLVNIDSLDAIVFNAGLQYTGSKKIRRSAQNIELTFAVNHLSHHYIFQRLYKLLTKSISPRVVITSSEVHNPLSSGGRIGSPAGIGELKGLSSSSSFEMLDGISNFNADKAYKDSKLCNALFARELYKRLLSANLQMPVICWAPGLIIPRNNEGFFRYSRKYNPISQVVFAFLARDLLRITETEKGAGHILNELTVSDEYNIKSFSFYSNQLVRPGKLIFKNGSLSEEARDDIKAKTLWELSNKLIAPFTGSDHIL